MKRGRPTSLQSWNKKALKQLEETVSGLTHWAILDGKYPPKVIVWMHNGRIQFMTHNEVEP